MKIAMYWHNGRSLGHTSEVAKVSKGILANKSGETRLLGVTGAFKGLDMLPEQMEIFKVPGFENFDTEKGLLFTNKMNLDREKLFQLRSKLISLVMNEYRPECFIVNHEPYGLDKELTSTLNELNNCQCILSLRGIIYGAEETNKDYFSKETSEWIDRHYETIVIHTDPNLFCLEEYYRIPSYLQRKMHYVGYLESKSELTKAVARQKLGIDKNEKVMVVSMGGGQGAHKIWKNIIQASRENRDLFDKVVLITGPYLEADSYQKICNDLKGDSLFLTMKYSTMMKEWMKGSDLFIGAAGANMISEILSVRCNAIVIPRQISESEQLIHSTILSSKGLVRMCSLGNVYEGELINMIRQALLEPIIIGDERVLMNGANNYYKYLGT